MPRGQKLNGGVQTSPHPCLVSERGTSTSLNTEQTAGHVVPWQHRQCCAPRCPKRCPRSRASSCRHPRGDPAVAKTLAVLSQLRRRGEAECVKAAQQLSVGKFETSAGCLIKPPCGLFEIHHAALKIVPTILAPLGRAGSTRGAFV